MHEKVGLGMRLRQNTLVKVIHNVWVLDLDQFSI